MGNPRTFVFVLIYTSSRFAKKESIRAVLMGEQSKAAATRQYGRCPDEWSGAIDVRQVFYDLFTLVVQHAANHKQQLTAWF